MQLSTCLLLLNVPLPVQWPICPNLLLPACLKSNFTDFHEDCYVYRNLLQNTLNFAIWWQSCFVILWFGIPPYRCIRSFSLMPAKYLAINWIQFTSSKHLIYMKPVTNLSGNIDGDLRQILHFFISFQYLLSEKEVG